MKHKKSKKSSKRAGKELTPIVSDEDILLLNRQLSDTQERTKSSGYFLQQNFKRAQEKMERQQVFEGNIFKILKREPGIAEGQYDYERTIMTPSGSAMIVHDYGDDFPTVSFETQTDMGKIVDIAVAVDWSIKDLRVAAYRNRPLKADKLWAARIAQEQKINELGFWGAPEVGIEGLFSKGNYIPRLVMTEALVKGADSEIIYDQFITFLEMSMEISILAGQFNNRPDTLLLDQKTWSFLNSTPRYAGGNDLNKSLLSYIVENSSITSVQAIAECSELMPQNNGKRIAFCYQAGNANAATLVAPEIGRALPLQNTNAKFTVPILSKCGGTYIKNPLAMGIAEVPY